MEHLRTLADRLGLEPADVAGLAVALLGAVLAAAVALRPPGAGPPVPVVADVAADGALLEEVAPAAAPDGGASAVGGVGPADGSRSSGGAGRPGVGASTAGPVGEGAAPSGSVVVHVAGEVRTPGVHTLPAGARVEAAVAAAGGPTPDARTGLLNLARPLVDGEQVLVPGPGDGPAASVAQPGDGGAAAPALALLPDGRLDLNRATAADLEQLPGIGEVTAGRVLAWREEHGPFTEPVQLREVRGIGEVTWLDLQDLVGVGG